MYIHHCTQLHIFACGCRLHVDKLEVQNICKHCVATKQCLNQANLKREGSPKRTQLQEVSPNTESVPTGQEESSRPGPSTSTSMKRKKVWRMQSSGEVSTILSHLLVENCKKDTELAMKVRQLLQIVMQPVPLPVPDSSAPTEAYLSLLK